MTLARGTLYAEQAIHCEENHNSTFTRVDLIACYAAVCVLQCYRCGGGQVGYLSTIRGREGEVKRRGGQHQAGRTGQQPVAVGGNLEDQVKLVRIQNQTKHRGHS